MSKPNAKNERIKRRYAQYLMEARRQSQASVDKALSAIARFEASTKAKDFAAFHIEQAVKFKRALADERHPKTGKPLAAGTTNSVLKAVRAFFLWLADQAGYRSKIRYSDADYFNASNRHQRLARDAQERPSPSPEQIRHILACMPSAMPIEKRDRAIVAFQFLTGVRDGAVVGLKLRHVDLAERVVRQDASEVATKFSKTMITFFFLVGRDIEDIFTDYVRFLREELLWGLDDPLFPRTRVGRGPTGGFMAMGLDRAPWADAGRLREIVKAAFVAHGMPAYGPHSFRKTLARLGQQTCKTPEELKTWSQNLGHEDVLTTLMSYGNVPDDRRKSVMKELRERGA